MIHFGKHFRYSMASASYSKVTGLDVWLIQISLHMMSHTANDSHSSWISRFVRSTYARNTLWRFYFFACSNLHWILSVLVCWSVHCFVSTGMLPQTINLVDFTPGPHTLNITVVDIFGQSDSFVYRFSGVIPPSEYSSNSIR